MTLNGLSSVSADIFEIDDEGVDSYFVGLRRNAVSSIHIGVDFCLCRKYKDLVIKVLRGTSACKCAQYVSTDKMHINNKNQHFWEHVCQKLISVLAIDTTEQVDEYLTKSLPRTMFKKYCKTVQSGNLHFLKIQVK